MKDIKVKRKKLYKFKVFEKTAAVGSRFQGGPGVSVLSTKCVRSYTFYCPPIPECSNMISCYATNSKKRRSEHFHTIFANSVGFDYCNRRKIPTRRHCNKRVESKDTNFGGRSVKSSNIPLCPDVLDHFPIKLLTKIF